MLSASAMDEFPQRQLGRWADVGPQHLAHLVEGIPVLFLGIRGDAVAGHDQAKVAHVGVVGREQHADVAGDTGDDDAADLQVIEQGLERRVVETECFGLRTK